MRCFISIDLPKEVRNELSEIQKRIYSNDTKLLNVKPDNIHITLKFLGEIDGIQLDKIKGVLSKLKFKRFKARLNSMGVFPDENFIRIVWVGIEPKEKMHEIHDTLDNELHREGFPLDNEFESHATLARVKTVKHKRAFSELLNKIKINPLEFEINEISLKESILTPEGPIYSDIMKIKLQ